MKKQFVLVIGIWLSIFAQAQITFFKTYHSYNNTSHYVEQTTDGGFILAGGHSHPASGKKAYAIKLNSAGDTLWTKLYGTNAEFNSGKQTNDGGYVFLGIQKNSTSFDDDFFVVKTDLNGNTQWQKTIAGLSNISATKIKQMSDNNYVISGFGFGASDVEMHLVKLDTAGTMLWNFSYGTLDHDRVHDFQETTDGGIILTGDRYNMSTGSSAYLIKLNATGALQWSKSFSGSGFDLGRNVMQTSDGGFLFLGNRRDSVAIKDNMCIIKTDSTGVISWSKIYEGAMGDAVRSVNKTATGNYIIASATPGPGSAYLTNMLLSLITPGGNLIWSRQLGINDTSYFMTSNGTCAQETSDGGFILTGYSSTPAVGGFIYLAKTDSNGNNGCDSLKLLTVNSYTPTVSIPTLSINSILVSSNYAIPPAGVNDTITTFCTSVGVEEFAPSNTITIYPNPSTGLFNFKGIEKGSEIEIFDLIGKLVHSSIAGNTFETIDISGKGKGIYIYRIRKELNLIQSGKICVH